MQLNTHSGQRAFTLVEVLIFVTVLALFFVIAAAVTTTMLRNSKLNAERLINTHKAEELVEWARFKKENDWDEFLSKVSNTSYCFEANFNFSTDSWPPIGACEETLPFRRNLTLIKENDNKVTVQVLVSWNNLGKTYQIPISTILTRFD
jgi:Tfp pilus assembly protein PilX